jgi:hypothetical protein
MFKTQNFNKGDFGRILSEFFLLFSSNFMSRNFLLPELHVPYCYAKLDRLARSTLDLCNIAKRLEDKKVTLQVLDQNIDTSSSTGRLMFNMLATMVVPFCKTVF